MRAHYGAITLHEGRESVLQEKTRYTRSVQLTTAVADGDVESLAELLKAAEEAHAEYEKTHAEHDVEWPVWYAQWLLCRRDSFDAACAVCTPIFSGGTPTRILPEDPENPRPSDLAWEATEGGKYGGFY